MKRQITRMFQIALFYGQIAIGWSQIPGLPLSDAPAAPVVEVVAAPAGAIVQAAGAGFGMLGLGHIGWTSQNQQFGVTHTKNDKSFTITTAVGLFLSCPTTDTGRRASISAALQQPDPRYVVSLDEVTLSTAPTTISALTSCGSTTQHTLSVKVPTSASAGSINANVGFQVTLR